jgi:hypothetical protein
VLRLTGKAEVCNWGYAGYLDDVEPTMPWLKKKRKKREQEKRKKKEKKKEV